MLLTPVYGLAAIGTPPTYLCFSASVLAGLEGFVALMKLIGASIEICYSQHSRSIAEPTN